MGHYNNLNGEWWLYSVHCECAVYKLEIQESVGGEIDGWWERVLLKRAGAKPSEPETPDAGSGLVLIMLMRKKWEIMTIGVDNDVHQNDFDGFFLQVQVRS